MTEPEPDPQFDSPADTPDVHSSRLALIWDVIVFQFKLAFDGLRDVLLSPVSIVAGIMGLVAGGDDPHQYFRRVMRLGRRSEAWINLFGAHRHGTSDALVDSLREKVATQAQGKPWIQQAGTRLNETLDNVNAARSADGKRGPDA
ncbi:MAG: hypothetical protein RIE06_27750 [Roseibium album]|uniref:hypothetical protein n=1 Tax=Roseibium album TaxID=311410 RepID=UPI0032EAF59E